MRLFRLFRLFVPLMAGLALLGLPSASRAQIAVGISVAIAPPPLPVYEQPPIPGPGYLWTPGYWAYDDDDYYWVLGTWAEPPSVGLLWTPAYWGWNDGAYVLHEGYWGPHIGFYGGINYGFGYVGSGYEGGYWRGGVFSYNTTVNNFGGVHITNVYNKTIINNTAVTNVSFHGGTGGTTAQPTPQEKAALAEQHVAPTAAQTQHLQTASTNRDLRASVNHGSPAIAATSRPGAFTGPGVVAPNHATGPANTPAAGTRPLRANAAAAPAVKPLSTPRTTPGHDARAARTTRETTVDGHPGNADHHPAVHDRPPPRPTAQAPRTPPRPQVAVQRPPAPPPSKKPEKKPHG
jgi:hypothetical protein